MLRSLLKAQGYEAVTAKDGVEALELVNRNAFDLVITDLSMAHMDGMTLFLKIKALYPTLPVILLTAYASVETAFEAMNNGIFDYMTKPFKVDEMLATVKRAINAGINKAVTDSATPSAPLAYPFENMIAASSAMLQVCDMIRRAAHTVATVLISGEKGTGKEIVARAIHVTSPRKDAPWVTLDCAALPALLLEAELFGHVKDASAGVLTEKPGLLEIANQGTLFLKEISALPLALQDKLLRVLREKEICRVGGSETIPVDVRVIAASHADLEQLVVQNSFRADLYYRLAVIKINVPPLHDRPEDILPLARHIVHRETAGSKIHPNLSQDAADVLTAYRWPGNVRELENAIKHAVTFLHGAIITPEYLPLRIVNRADEAMTQQAAQPAASGGKNSLKGFLKLKEKEYLAQILSTAHGDNEKAGHSFQSSLYRKLSDTSLPVTP